MKYFRFSIFSFLAVIIAIMALPSCANIIPPGGGPRDSLPPRLIASLPRDSSVNIKPKTVVLTFDEYVTLQKTQENLIISPTVTNMPIVDSKLRNVTIKFRDSLEPNTTYTIGLGDAIVDVNESNIAKNFSYVFSTGNRIDQNTYSGKVLLAESGLTDSTLLVVLHNNLEDSAIRKDRPRYYTRINAKGQFVFRNLPAGRFAVYVVPNDYTKRYDDSTKMFAFLNEPVTIGDSTRQDTLYAFNAFKQREKTNAPTTIPTAPPTRNNNNSKGEDKRLKYTPLLINAQQDLLSDLKLDFNRRLLKLDTAKFILSDTNYVPLKRYGITLDSSQTRVHVSYPWKEATALKLVIEKDAVADSAGVTLSKTDTINFFTQKETEYGSLKISFTRIDFSRNPVLQLVQNGAIVDAEALTRPLFVRRLFRPGNYDVRILYDTNKNGVWDAGSFMGTKKQPEIVQAISSQVNVRANWDNEVNISL